MRALAVLLLLSTACVTVAPPPREQRITNAVKGVAFDSALVITGQTTALVGTVAALNARDGEKNAWWLIAGFGLVLSTLSFYFLLPNDAAELEKALSLPATAPVEK